MQTLVVTYPPMDGDLRSMQGKLLQVRLPDRDCLVLAASQACSYHNQALARLLTEQAIPCRWESAAVLVWEHPEVQVIGGGRFQLLADRQAIRVWDSSGVYGPFDPQRLADQLQHAPAPWSGLRLVALGPAAPRLR